MNELFQKLHQRIQSKTVKWERGFETNNEWVFISLETPESTDKLLDWLRSKNIEDSNQAIMVDPNWTVKRDVSYGELINQPKRFFRSAAFQVIDLDLQWTLEYLDQEIIRFGRYK